MTRTLPYDVQDSIKTLLLRKILLCSIKEMYPTVGMANLSKYRREFVVGAKYLVVEDQVNLNGPRGAQKFLRSINISMSLSGAEKLLNEIGFKTKRKNKTNFVSAANKKLSEFFYWSDVPGTNRPHQVQPQVQDSGDGVMFWGCISGDRPRYSTAIIDGTIDSNEYVEILKKSFMQTLEYYGEQVKSIRFHQNEFFVDKILDLPPQNPDLNSIKHIGGDLKRRLDAYPNRPAT
ncbi:hypothetical protein INT46_003108, partial [Mucor plumbeus]